jgi:hypothetical protein
MPVEAYLTRQLNIRFIDARNICTEAKVSLGVEGYPTDDQEVMLIQESIQIFARRPNESKTAMRRLKSDLDAVKNPAGSASSLDETRRLSASGSEDASSLSNASEFAGDKSSQRRRTQSRFKKFWSA